MTAPTLKPRAGLRSAGGPETFVDVLDLRAAEPDREAVSFLRDDDTIDRYANRRLDERVRQVAALLRERLPPGARAVLLYPPGPEYLVALLGCMRAGVVAVPAYPPDPNRLQRTLPRLLAIVRDAQAAALLTLAPLRDGMEEFLRDSGDGGQVRVLATDVQMGAAAPDWRCPGIGPDSIAILQYTSGSTATPRGVRLTHRNLLANSEAIRIAFGHTIATRGVSWLPTYHDMGLIGSLLQPLYVSFPVLKMSPIAFLRRPLRWLQAISDYRATGSGGPNFAYALAVRRTTPEQRAKLDLSCWETAFNGAEPIRAETLDSFVEAFGPCGFRREAFLPCYGLAESTLIVTGKPPETSPRSVTVDRHALAEGRVRIVASEHDGGRSLVSCGRPVQGAHVLIADPVDPLPREPLHVGEILVAGASVASGYWQQPEANAATFGALPAYDGDRGFVRSGDLGFLLDGELYVTGRIRDLIILRGRNYDPAEVELACEDAAPELRRHCGAAFGVQPDGGDGTEDQRLVVVYEVGDDPQRPYEAVIQAMRQAVARRLELQLGAVVLVRPRTIPKTSSGKLQRGACRLQYLSGDLDAVGEWTLLDGDDTKARTD